MLRKRENQIGFLLRVEPAQFVDHVRTDDQIELAFGDLFGDIQGKRFVCSDFAAGLGQKCRHDRLIRLDMGLRLLKGRDLGRHPFKTGKDTADPDRNRPGSGSDI